MLNLFKQKKQVISITPSVVVFTFALMFGLWMLYSVREIAIMFFLGFLVMVALNPAVNRLQSIIKSRMVSILIVYLLVVSFIVSVFILVVPPLAHQLTLLAKNINLPYFQEELSKLKFDIQELNQWATTYGGSINALLSVAASTFKGLFTLVAFLVISVYLIADEPVLHKKIGWFTHSKHHFKIFREFLDSIEDNLGGWIRAQIIIMSMIGIVTYIGLTIIGLPYALPLSLLAFLLEILPNLGPTLAAAPAILIALITGGPINALIVLIFYVALQQVESNLIMPKVMKKSADVNALVSIMSILSGFQLGGVIGGLLAIPIYILLRTVFGYYKKYEAKLKPDW